MAQMQVDPRWVVAAQHGDQNAVNWLYQNCYSDVYYRIASSVQADEATLHSLTQETFNRAFRDLARLTDPGKFAPWLDQLAWETASASLGAAAAAAAAVPAAASVGFFHTLAFKLTAAILGVLIAVGGVATGLILTLGSKDNKPAPTQPVLQSEPAQPTLPPDTQPEVTVPPTTEATEPPTTEAAPTTEDTEPPATETTPPATNPSSGGSNPAGSRTLNLSDLVGTLREEDIVYTDGVGNDYNQHYLIYYFLLNSPDAIQINRIIETDVVSLLDEALEEAQSGYSLSTMSITADAWIWNRTVTILMKATPWYEGGTYFVYTLDADSGTEVSPANLATLKGLTSDQLWEMVRNTAERTYLEYFSGAVANGFASEDFYNQQYERTIDETNVRSSKIYVDRDGKLHGIIRVYSLAGGDSYLHDLILTDVPAESEDPSAESDDPPETRNLPPEVRAAYRRALEELHETAYGRDVFDLVYLDDDEYPELVWAADDIHIASFNILKYNPQTGEVENIGGCGSDSEFWYLDRGSVLFGFYMGTGGYSSELSRLEGTEMIGVGGCSAELDYDTDKWGDIHYYANGVETTRADYEGVFLKLTHKQLAWGEDGLEDPEASGLIHVCYRNAIPVNEGNLNHWFG